MTSRQELLELLRTEGVAGPRRRSPPVILDGAEVYDLNESRSRDVMSFMSGLNRTRPVCFGREGLETTASGTDERLLVANELGRADIHMILLSLGEEDLVITYCDVDEQRVWFLRLLVGSHSVEWSPLTFLPSSEPDDGSSVCEGYYLLRGCLRIPDTSARHRLLGTLGARLPFLVGWREAYQALRRFVGGDEVEAILECAAAVEVGHAALLDLGGGELVAEVLEQSFGQDVWVPDLLGPVQTSEFLKDVLGITWRARLEETAGNQVQGQILAAFKRHLRVNSVSTARSFRDFTIVAVDGAFVLRDLLRAMRRGDTTAVKRSQRLLQRYVTRGDQYLRQLCRLGGEDAKATVILPVVAALNDARAALRDAARGLSILHAGQTPLKFIGDMQRLVELCVQTTQETVRMALTSVQVDASDSDDERRRRLDALRMVTDRARQLRHYLLRSLAERPVETVGEVAIALNVVEAAFRACELFSRAVNELYELITLCDVNALELDS